MWYNRHTAAFTLGDEMVEGPPFLVRELVILFLRSEVEKVLKDVLVQSEKILFNA